MNPLREPATLCSMRNDFFDIGLTTIKELETDNGILASGREEVYGCIFGRDSLITCLKLLRVYEALPEPYFLGLARKILTNLVKLQGKSENIESGEEPGKCIHEYRPTGHEHLTQRAWQPWYVYPDNIMRNYDSVDATPLLLVALYRYAEIAGADETFLKEVLGGVVSAIEWIFGYGDKSGGGFINYQFPHGRQHGGLGVQNWVDSAESVFHEDGSVVTYPVAPVEVQAYTWLALRLWAQFFASRDHLLSRKLEERAAGLKRRFNETFVFASEQPFSIAYAIDGAAKPMRSVRSNPGHILWASLRGEQDAPECILQEVCIPKLAGRLLEADLFEPMAGIRTLSTESRGFNLLEYANGSIYPHDNGMIIEGLERFGYTHEAEWVRRALRLAFDHFKTPIEFYVCHDGSLSEGCSPFAKPCKKAAWSAAAMLELSLAPESPNRLV